MSNHPIAEKIESLIKHQQGAEQAKLLKESLMSDNPAVIEPNVRKLAQAVMQGILEMHVDLDMPQRANLIAYELEAQGFHISLGIKDKIRLAHLYKIQMDL